MQMKFFLNVLNHSFPSTTVFSKIKDIKIKLLFFEIFRISFIF